VRAIFELAVVQPALDMPELLWKAYIDFEEEEAEYERTRALYERLLEKTDHVKVWTSYAHFEINVPDNDAEAANENEEIPISDAAKARARAVFTRAHKLYKSRDLTSERVALLNAWKSFEDAHGSEADKEAIAKQMPRKVKKRRRLDDDSFEEYMDYVFPADDAGAAGMSKLMAAAAAFKRQQQLEGAGAS
jgi:crooked neck